MKRSEDYGPPTPPRAGDQDNALNATFSSQIQANNPKFKGIMKKVSLSSVAATEMTTDSRNWAAKPVSDSVIGDMSRGELRKLMKATPASKKADQAFGAVILTPSEVPQEKEEPQDWDYFFGNIDKMKKEQKKERVKKNVLLTVAATFLVIGAAVVGGIVVVSAGIGADSALSAEERALVADFDDFCANFSDPLNEDNYNSDSFGVCIGAELHECSKAGVEPPSVECGEDLCGCSLFSFVTLETEEDVCGTDATCEPLVNQDQDLNFFEFPFLFQEFCRSRLQTLNKTGAVAVCFKNNALICDLSGDAGAEVFDKKDCAKKQVLCGCKERVPFQVEADEFVDAKDIVCKETLEDFTCEAVSLLDE